MSLILRCSAVFNCCLNLYFYRTLLVQFSTAFVSCRHIRSMVVLHSA